MGSLVQQAKDAQRQLATSARELIYTGNYRPPPAEWPNLRDDMLPLHMLKQVDIPCSYCGAAAGHGCRPMGPFDEAWYGGHHLTRDHETKLANAAAQALDPPKKTPKPWTTYYGTSIVYPKLRARLLVDTVS